MITKNQLVIMFLAPMMVLALAGQAQTTPSLRDIKDKTKNQREAIKAQTKETLVKIRETRLENIKDKAEKAKENITEKREALKEKIQNFKDEQKKKILEHVYNNINALNERLMKHYENVLSRLEVILSKIENRMKVAKENGKDVSSVETAIAAARSKIADARSLAEAQLGKVYSLDITNEETLKKDVGAIRKAFHLDVSKIHQAVLMARKTVQRAAETLAKIPKVDELKPVDSN